MLRDVLQHLGNIFAERLHGALGSRRFQFVQPQLHLFDLPLQLRGLQMLQMTPMHYPEKITFFVLLMAVAFYELFRATH